MDIMDVLMVGVKGAIHHEENESVKLKESALSAKPE